MTIIWYTSRKETLSIYILGIILFKYLVSLVVVLITRRAGGVFKLVTSILVRGKLLSHSFCPGYLDRIVLLWSAYDLFAVKHLLFFLVEKKVLASIESGKKSKTRKRNQSKLLRSERSSWFPSAPWHEVQILSLGPHVRSLKGQLVNSSTPFDLILWNKKWLECALNRLSDRRRSTLAIIR